MQWIICCRIMIQDNCLGQNVKWTMENISVFLWFIIFRVLKLQLDIMHRMLSTEPLPKWQTGLAVSVDHHFMIKGMKIHFDFQCCDPCTPDTMIILHLLEHFYCKTVIRYQSWTLRPFWLYIHSSLSKWIKHFEQ